LLLSMTGFGEATTQNERWTIAVEQLVREQVRRGTVHISVRIDRPKRPDDYRINLVALSSYREQLKGLRGFDDLPVDLGALLVLPGVVEDCRSSEPVPDRAWAEIAEVVQAALAKLQTARSAEGRVMAAELTAMARCLESHLSVIVARGPQVTQNHHKRLVERVSSIVREYGIGVEPGDLVREVAILADRSDISEEIVRLRAHLCQFSATIDEAESAGRKLEFISQEMGREVNTIGSKAGDVEISRSVVEIKALLEKIRELIQNVE
jgi:uncharacterized protein (TIGR00255 family)